MMIKWNRIFLPVSHVLAGYTGQLTQLVIIIISLNIFI